MYGQLSGFPVTTLYNFGQPRTGDDTFAGFYTSAVEDAGIETYRVTHWKDPVPSVPYESWGFHHEALGGLLCDVVMLTVMHVMFRFFLGGRGDCHCPVLSVVVLQRYSTTPTALSTPPATAPAKTPTAPTSSLCA